MTIKKSSSSGIPSGLNAGRPANPGFGQLYANGEAARLELYTQASGWQNIIQETIKNYFPVWLRNRLKPVLSHTEKHVSHCIKTIFHKH